MAATRGFTRGDFDPAYALDDKFRRLAVALSRRDYLAAEGLWWELISAAWRDASRAAIRRVIPDAPDDLVDALRTAGLLDSREMVPRRAFDQWIGAALDRRAADRDRQAGHRASKNVTRDTKTKSEMFQPERLSRVTPPVSPQDRYRSGSPTPEDVGRGSRDDDEPEFPAIVWLARHGASVPPSGNGYHRKLIEVTERHGIDKVVEALEATHLAGGRGDRALVLGAANLLDPIPSGRQVAAVREGVEDRRRSSAAQERTRRMLDEQRSFMDDLGVAPAPTNGHSGAYRRGNVLSPAPQVSRSKS